MRGVRPLSLFAGCAAAAPPATYRAAVVEFVPEKVTGTENTADALAIRRNNLARAEEYMAQAKANGTQIIVFPEYGMIGDLGEGPGEKGLGWWNRDNILPFLEQIPDPHASAGRLNPCEQKGTLEATAPLTVGGSCLAKKYGMALVLGLGDMHPCTPGTDAGAKKKCPEDGRVQFNAAIAFGEDGALLERYHKKHDASEPCYDFAPNSAPQGRFRTQFGVDFGMFICKDIFWETGTYNVTNFIFPTEWDNIGSIVGMNAIEEQTKWSKKHAANFLASNIGYDKTKSGSGIYSSGTPLATFYNPTNKPQEKLLIADVPIIG